MLQEDHILNRSENYGKNSTPVNSLTNYYALKGNIKAQEKPKCVLKKLMNKKFIKKKDPTKNITENVNFSLGICKNALEQYFTNKNNEKIRKIIKKTHRYYAKTSKV